MSEDLRYPIGKFQFPDSVSDADLKRMIGEIADTPSRLYEAASILDGERLRTPYRPGGWTLEQVIHHLPDSHLNSYIRFKLAVTEDEPTIKGYDEAAWAELPDARAGIVLASLELRVPLWRGPHGLDLSLAPFVDLGHGWNRHETPSVRTLASAGLGLRARWGRRASLAAYWGHRLRDLPRSRSGLQDAGVYLELVVRSF